MNRQKSSAGYWRGLVTGLMIGGGAALLLAQRKKREDTTKENETTPAEATPDQAEKDAWNEVLEAAKHPAP